MFVYMCIRAERGENNREGKGDRDICIYVGRTKEGSRSRTITGCDPYRMQERGKIELMKWGERMAADKEKSTRRKDRIIRTNL